MGEPFLDEEQFPKLSKSYQKVMSKTTIDNNQLKELEKES